MTIEERIQTQRAYFQSGVTFSVSFRISMLKKLREAIDRHEKEICEALSADLGKSDFESFMCEIGMVRSELSHMLRHVKRYSKEKRVPTPLAQFPARSYVKPTPYGNVLIMSPWNYPFLLSIGPLIDALAAGNTAIVKPSAYSPATSAVVERILTECFDPAYVAVVTGGRKENSALLQQKFDLVFFTGSQSVGREVLRHTAETLTPAVLELGGKSPCIVDSTAKIRLAAKRIVFGKLLNCGQTCVAPDYVLCHESVQQELTKEICLQIQKQYGTSALENPDYGRIINRRHFERITRLIDPDKVAIGGGWKEVTLQIEPTVLVGVDWKDAVMQEEIFGPVLPILTYRHTEEIFRLLEERAKPLALYIFSEDRKTVEDITSRCRYGGGCVNDCMVHLANTDMGFGGVGESGMGAYHGKRGFDTFSHAKSILNKKTWLDLPMRYQPYKRSLYGKFVRFFLK